MTDKIIAYDSPEAASIQTVTGWVSSKGRFWGKDEHAARYDGCTHLPCTKCGAIIEVRSYCRACYERRECEKYTAMPRAKWDGKSMLYSNARNEFYNDMEDAENRLEDGQTLADLEIVICNPVNPRPLSEDYFSDQLPDESDYIPDVLIKAIADFNAAIAECPALSWTPGNFALELEDR